ncbi:MAG: hypothetical protein HKUEN07_34030 [Rhodocyclaceae bacterium]|nr:MAG: hypothetical protein HKUEN07_34030 [Rhodocyclaceae bacterium]
MNNAQSLAAVHAPLLAARKMHREGPAHPAGPASAVTGTVRAVSAEALEHGSCW